MSISGIFEASLERFRASSHANRELLSLLKNGTCICFEKNSLTAKHDFYKDSVLYVRWLQHSCCGGDIFNLTIAPSYHCKSNSFRCFGFAACFLFTTT